MTDRPEHPTNRSDEHHLLRYRVDQLEVSQSEVREAIKSIDSNLRTLTDVQRQLDSLADTEVRLRVIERELPTLKLARKWVLAAMTTGSAAVSAGVFALLR